MSQSSRWTTVTEGSMVCSLRNTHTTPLQFQRALRPWVFPTWLLSLYKRNVRWPPYNHAKREQHRHSFRVLIEYQSPLMGIRTCLVPNTHQRWWNLKTKQRIKYDLQYPNLEFLSGEWTHHVRRTLTYRSAIFYHGVVHFMTLCNSTRKEAALADVIIKVL